MALTHANAPLGGKRMCRNGRLCIMFNKYNSKCSTLLAGLGGTNRLLERCFPGKE